MTCLNLSQIIFFLTRTAIVTSVLALFQSLLYTSSCCQMLRFLHCYQTIDDQGSICLRLVFTSFPNICNGIMNFRVFTAPQIMWKKKCYLFQGFSKQPLFHYAGFLLSADSYALLYKLKSFRLHGEKEA